MKRIFFFSVLALLLSLRAVAQVVEGVVTDASMGDPLPMVHVYYADDKSTLVQTDINGRYRIRARAGMLVFSMMGFDTQMVEVEAKGRQRLNVKMRESASALREVEVVKKRKKYVRKNNPAVELMRRVIAAKSATDLRQRDFLSYRKYEKMTFSVNEVTDQILRDDHFRRLPFLKEHVERHPETGKLVLPLTIDERVSRVLYRKEPRTEKTIVEAERSEGVSNLINTGEILTGVMADCFTDVDIYQDQVRLLQYPFTSPISEQSALGFYRYFIIDTLQVGADRCYRIDFTPNNPQDFGFSGSLFVMADSTLRVRRVDMGIPSRSDVNFVDEMHIVQDFQTLPTGEQVVTGSRMRVALSLVSWLQKVQVERSVSHSEWDFAPIPESSLRFQGDTRVEPSAALRDPSYWQAERPDTLSQGEARVDQLVDRFYRIKGFKPLLWVARAFIENYVETSINPQRPSLVDIGPINAMLGSNFVEGFHLRAGAQTTAQLHPHWFLRGYVKYGFGDDRWKGMGQVTYSFNRKDHLPHEYPMRNLTFTYENDISSPSDKFASTDRDNVFVSFKWTPVKHMNYFERFNLRLDWEWQNGLSLYAQARREEDRGAGDLFYRTLAAPEPAADATAAPNLRHIRFAEATLGLRYQPGASYINTKQHRLTTNLDAPILGLSHTTGVKGLLGGQYDYNFTEATLYKRFWLRSWGKADFMLKGGVQWNRVPHPFLIMPAANMSYIIQNNTFSLVRNMEFPSDRYASLMASWDLNGKLLNRVPLLSRLQWREFLGVNCLWGQLTDKNNPLLAQNQGDSRLFYFPGSYASDGSFRYASRVLSPRKPYVEVVVGLHNIFRFFRLEYVQRLNYIYDDTHRWGIRGCFEMSF